MKMFWLPTLLLSEDHKEEGLHACLSEMETTKARCPPLPQSSLAVDAWLGLLTCLSLPNYTVKSLVSSAKCTLLAATEKVGTGHRQKPYYLSWGMETRPFSSAMAAGQTDWKPTVRGGTWEDSDSRGLAVGMSSAQHPGLHTCAQDLTHRVYIYSRG